MTTSFSIISMFVISTLPYPRSLESSDCIEDETDLIRSDFGLKGDWSSDFDSSTVVYFHQNCFKFFEKLKALFARTIEIMFKVLI